MRQNSSFLDTVQCALPFQDLPPINTRADIGLSDQDLVQISTKDLNKLMKKKGIGKDRAKHIKQERRTLKNRGYAASCRDKREKEENTIRKVMEQMWQEQRTKAYEIMEGKLVIERKSKLLEKLNYESEQLRREEEEVYNLNY